MCCASTTWPVRLSPTTASTLVGFLTTAVMYKSAACGIIPASSIFAARFTNALEPLQPVKVSRLKHATEATTIRRMAERQEKERNVATMGTS